MINTGKLQSCPDICAVGDWVEVNVVPDWGWSQEPHRHPPEGEEMVFLLRPSVGGERKFVWQRMS